MKAPCFAHDEPEVLSCRTPVAWEGWLTRHHATARGVWLLIAKKNSGVALLTIDQALDAALCFGWIDSQRKAHDARCFVQRYSPRRPGSAWSAINLARVEVLRAAGRMRSEGLLSAALGLEPTRRRIES